ncbi:MAG: DUF1926 domain-containing protein [bacterium]|nr:DUF1926 domain-containing protein [bacterium]
MTRFRLAIGLHNHQPVGNFDHVFEEAHQQAYKPFLELLAQYPKVSLSLHQSGILWDWQEKHHPEYLEQVKRLVADGRIELMTGGFYEPILTSIPQRDLRGQIEKLTGFLRNRFSADISGLWLTERVWEPHLPKVLAESGVGYLPVDDTHFLFAGMERSQLTGPFVTEFEGETVTLLPIQKKLRYLIPFGKVEEVISELKRQAEISLSGVAVYADDGEKFGVWPNTHKHCYDDRWLAEFFEALERNADWLEVVPLKVAADMTPVGRVYLPSASYEEMGHWALPTPGFLKYEAFEHWLKTMQKAEEHERFVRAGHWRGFLTKYEESNLMHKKMLAVSERLATFDKAHPEMNAQLEPVRDRLYAAQCNCAYWHGVFGGLYLPHLRQAIYAALLEAESKLRELAHTRVVTIAAKDHDADRRDEILVESAAFSAVFKPDRGGMLVDLGLLRHAFDLTDTLARRKEGYHRKLAVAQSETPHDGTASIHDLVIAKEPGLEKILVEDQYLKRCFIDHFLAEKTSVELFQSAQVEELGDFATGAYAAEFDADSGRVTLTRDGKVGSHGRQHAVRLTKNFYFLEEADRLEITYELRTTDGSTVSTHFAIENSFSFQAGHAHDRYLLIDSQRPSESFLDSVGSHQQVSSVGMVDDWRGLAVVLQSQRAGEIWHHPIHTVSLSEAGFEKVYQGTTILNCFHISISPEPMQMKFTLHAGSKESVLREIASSALAGNF